MQNPELEKESSQKNIVLALKRPFLQKKPWIHDQIRTLALENVAFYKDSIENICAFTYNMEWM